jgi:MoaA/NifB/PqqE/SkfB family radical SAM enzyme
MNQDGTLKGYMQVLGGKVLQGEKFKFIFLALSNKCPSYCQKCYQDAGPLGKVRTVEESLFIVNSLQEQGFIVMAEMMELIPETVPLLEIYQKTGSKQISTGGGLLVEDPAVFDSLRKYNINEVRITLEHPAIHYKWCGRERDTAKQAITKSLEEGFRVVMNSVVSKSTLPYLDEICQEGQKLGVHQINLLNYIFENRARSMPEEVLDEKDIENFHAKYTQLRKTYREKGIVIDRTGNFGPNPDPNSLSGQLSSNGLACWAGKGPHGEEYFIDINNNVYPCMLIRSEEMIIGKLVDGKLRINKDPMKNWHRKTCYSLHRQL